MLAGGLDGLVQLDGVTIQGDLGVLFHRLGDVDRGDRTKSLARRAGGECELELQALELGGDLLGFGFLLGFTRGANFLEVLDALKIGFGGFKSLALWNQEVTGETALHSDDVGLGAESFDLLF